MSNIEQMQPYIITGFQSFQLALWAAILLLIYQSSCVLKNIKINNKYEAELSIILIGSLLMISTIALAFWRRVFDGVVVFLNPTIDPSLYGRVTGILSLLIAYILIFWFHGIMRHSCKKASQDWKIERRLSTTILIGCTIATVGGM